MLTYGPCYTVWISNILCQVWKISVLLHEIVRGVWTRCLLLPFPYTPSQWQLAISITWPKCWVPCPIWNPSTKSFASKSWTYFNILLDSLSIDQAADILLCKPTSYLSCFIFQQRRANFICKFLWRLVTFMLATQCKIERKVCVEESELHFKRCAFNLIWQWVWMN